MTRGTRRGVLTAAALAAALASSPAPAADPPPAKLPFSDDVMPPPPLPKSLDRAFKGEIVKFEGDRITLRWDWKDPAQLADFESFTPVRATLRGAFRVKDGRVEADGTAGIHVRLGFLSDLEVHVGPTRLRDPHDLGIALAAPGVSDESILCLVQDRLFTRFDAAAGNTNMINKLGGIVSPTPGMVEFRYVDRRIEPRLEPDAEVTFDVLRAGPVTTFTITPKGAPPREGKTGAKGEVASANTLTGKDTDTPMTRFTPGLYVSGGAADFGPLTISGRIDPQWCADHGVVPHMANDLLHPGNKWKPPDRKLAEMVERFAKGAANGPGPAVTAEQIAPLLGNVKAPLVIRIRAAEALMAHDAGEAVAERLASVLDSKDQAARVLAWQILRPKLPWHFRYEADGDPKTRREAALLIAEWLRKHEDEESLGKVYVEGEWLTPERADRYRSEWANAWDLRTPHVRVRSDVPKKWADWYLRALEAEYAELVRLVGREPPAKHLPLSVLVFKDADGYEAFCKSNGYDAMATWGRFFDGDRNVSLVTFHAKDGLATAMGLLAKQFLRFATGKHWPDWYDEGRASWFGNAEYGTVSFDGETLQVGIPAKGPAVRLIQQAVRDEKLPGIIDCVAKDPRALSSEERRIWYVQAWALHAWLLDGAPETIRRKFADWQSRMEKLPTTSRTVDDVGLTEFLTSFSRDLPDMDRDLREWIKRL